jgi:hypothetical protein
MPMDFSKIAPVRTVKRPVDPVELFQSLKVTDPAINDLWLAQGDALRAWDKSRANGDTAIILNTGAGKTLVGLLAAQSLVNETSGHVVFACSSIQLVEQTASKAKGYGLDVTTYFRHQFSNDLYQSGLAPCITTYQALFNGKSRFFRENLSAGVFDDAHTAEHLLRDHFTLRIKRSDSEKLFVNIVRLFAGYHNRTGSGVGYTETFRNKDGNKTWFVPPFVLRANIGEVQRLLTEADLHENRETMFAWQHLKDYLDLCCLFISGQEISFTPPVVPTLTLPYFQNGVRRLYLSATLTAKDAFLRGFGKTPGPIIAPKTTAGECERLIIAPRLNPRCRDKEIEVAKEAIGDKKTLLLVPSNRAAAKWSDVVGEQQSDNVTEQVEGFKKAAAPAKLRLVGRYDGVDLPGDTCRMMVIDELPSSMGPLERYLWEKLNLQKILRSTVASRVVQSFGRISRGMSDHGVVILTGDSLVSWLLIPANRALLPSFLRRQLDLGFHLSGQADTCEELIGTADQCLRRDPGWCAFYQNSMGEAETATDGENVDEGALNLARVEVAFGNAFWSREYDEAAHALNRELEKTFRISGNAGAWHALWLGYCYELLGDSTQAQVMYRQARGATKNIPPPDVQIEAAEGQEFPAQVVEVARYLYNGSNVDRAGFRNFASDLTALDGTGTPAQTEEAVRKLGEYLGLESSRPDNEVGTGPDVLWDTPGGPAFNQELKTEKDAASKYRKKDVGQLYDHIQWVRENSPSARILSTFVGPVVSATNDANPGPDVTVIELSEYSALAERLRVALEDICARALPVTLSQTIYEVFKERNLLWPGLYDQMRKHVLREIS